MSTASLNEGSGPTGQSNVRSNLFGNQDGGSTGSGYAPSSYSQGSGSQGQYSQGQYSSGDAYSPSRSGRASTMERAELPPPQQPAADTYRPSYSPPPSQSAPSRSGYQSGYVPPIEPRQPAYQQPSYSAAPAAGTGDKIEVRQGDTLYSLSRRHNVSIAELMSANNLSSPSLKPGQTLYLPSGASAGAATAPPARESAYETASSRAADAPADWTGSYTMKQGDSLYAIARRHNVKVSELERYNGITDVRKVKPGTTLRLPASAASAPAAEEAPPVTASNDAPPPASSSDSYAPPSAQPTILNAREPAASADNRVAKLDTPSRTDDSGAGAPGSGSVAGAKLRWPVMGKIVSGFGPRPDGTHNDGINVAAPMGTDIHAAENGVVAYAGDELKGYGNLVLVRHDNGWVTAYAHADELLVKRGDRIKRGQIIAKAGRTGQVDQPQVHFELRQGQKPVDPTPFLERL
jgi:murein DD-endopeptidase MepM/ murein hydrolase activator NlpD